MKKLRVFNTVTSSLEEFTPIDGTNIRMYVCGPTVYSAPHIGNLRSVATYDMIFRTLKHLYGHVTYVRNITDVDDKIIESAIAQGVSVDDITSSAYNFFTSDYTYLHCLNPTIEPKATDYIGKMVDCILLMLEKGFAYEVSGHIMFDVQAYKEFVSLNSGFNVGVVAGDTASCNTKVGSGSLCDVSFSNNALGSGVHSCDAAGHLLGYGALSGHVGLESVGRGTRDIDQINKRNPEDFVLWKPAPCENNGNYTASVTKDESTNVPSSTVHRGLASNPACTGWHTPLGYGRPGWHTECVAMSIFNLGLDFDLHGGGMDLKFPHHDNELAQAQCLNPGHLFAKYWVHNGILLADGQKMSKTDGNIVTLEQLRKHGFTGSALKYFLLSAHYRQPLNMQPSALQACQERIDRLIWVFANTDTSHLVERTDMLDDIAIADLLRDFNTPEYIASINTIANSIERTGRTGIPSIDGAVETAHHASQALFSMGLLIGLWTKESLESDLRDIRNKGLVRILVSHDPLPSQPQVHPEGTTISNAKEEDYNAALISLARKRWEARKNKNYKEADEIRDKLRSMGCEVEDKDGVSELVLSGNKQRISPIGARVHDSATIRRNVCLGSCLSVGTGSTIGESARIGDNVSIGDDVEIGDNVSIGNNVEIGNGAKVLTRSIIGNMVRISKLSTIGAYAEIGDNSIIGESVAVGSFAIVAGGSKVKNGVRLQPFCRISGE